MDKTTAHLPGIRDDPPSSPDTDAEYALKTARPIRLWGAKKAHAAWEDPAALQAGGRWFEPGTAHPPPPVFSREMLDTALERPWHKRDEAEELPRAWSDQGEDDVELDTEDETGFVSPLEPEPTA